MSRSLRRLAWPSTKRACVVSRVGADLRSGDGRSRQKPRANLCAPCRKPQSDRGKRSVSGGRLEHVAQLETEMEIESRLRVVESQVADVLDPAQPVEHGVAVEMQQMRDLRR
jgi:hypothetical protein